MQIPANNPVPYPYRGAPAVAVCVNADAVTYRVDALEYLDSSGQLTALVVPHRFTDSATLTELIGLALARRFDLRRY